MVFFQPIRKALPRVVASLMMFSLPIASFAQTAAPQQAQSITVEGIYTGKYREMTAMPMKTWLSDGTLVLLDARKPATERVYEALNPQTGKRTPLFDMAKARTSLKALRGTENVP
ncbi:MAG: hypothetical protein ACOVSW_13135, partial [Candidatus Kapaibacteriota bacterium]